MFAVQSAGGGTLPLVARVLDNLLDGEDLALSRVSTVDQVANQLRTMIADGRLPQGEHLREMPLAAAFSVSRTTIRDAIRALSTEGLVSLQFHRGAIVTILTDEDIVDVYRIRRLLELPALEMVEEGAPEVTKRVEKALKACQRAADDQDYSVFVEHELEFHAAIVSYLGSPRTDQFFANVLASLRLALSVLGTDRRPSTIISLSKRYREIFDAAREGDVAGAQRQLGSHLDAYEARLRTNAPAAADTPAATGR
jgi:DNA-binding GntR family transcriptional regulator